MSVQKENNSFSIIEFVLDNGVEVVPNLWLSEDKDTCRFPNPIPRGFSRIQNDSSFIPSDDWTIYQVNFVGSFETFDKAFKKAAKYIKNKPIETSEEGNSRRKRRGNQQSLAKESTLDQTLTPIEPFQAIEIPVLDDVHDDISSVDNISTFEFEERPVVGDVLAQGIQFIQLEDGNGIQNHEILLNEFRKFQEESLRNQQLLLERIQQLEKIVLHSLKTSSDSVSNSHGWIWPLKTEAELDLFEIHLKDSKFYNQQVIILSKIGGNSLSKSIYNTLHWMIADEFALKIRFTDKSGKKAFGNRLIAQLVRDSIKTGNSGSEVTDTTINKYIGSWFRQSREREKSRSKKNDVDIGKDTEASSRETGSSNPKENSTL